VNEQCRCYQKSLGDPALTEDLIRHGETCEICRDFTQAQQALQRVLPFWREPEYSADFALSVMSQLAEEGSKRRTAGDLLSELFRFRLSIPLPVGVLAGFLLVISLSLNFAFWPQSQPGIHNLPFQVADIANGNSPMGNSAAAYTPAVIPVAEEKTTEFANGAWIVPREFLGAGAFLLVPIFDANHVLGNRTNEAKQQSDANRGI
jgi:hypothetical protein